MRHPLPRRHRRARQAPAGEARLTAGAGAQQAGGPPALADRVFVLGLLFVLLGIALTALPGPLTIPPVLVGLWIWSTEFHWAALFFAASRRKAQDAWRHARQHPVSSAAVTAGGLAAAGLAFWAVGHYQLVDQARLALGI